MSMSDGSMYHNLSELKKVHFTVQMSLARCQRRQRPLSETQLIAATKTYEFYDRFYSHLMKFNVFYVGSMEESRMLIKALKDSLSAKGRQNSQEKNLDAFHKAQQKAMDKTKKSKKELEGDNKYIQKVLVKAMMVDEEVKSELRKEQALEDMLAQEERISRRMWSDEEIAHQVDLELERREVKPLQPFQDPALLQPTPVPAQLQPTPVPAPLQSIQDPAQLQDADTQPAQISEADKKKALILEVVQHQILKSISSDPFLKSSFDEASLEALLEAFQKWKEDAEGVKQFRSFDSLPAQIDQLRKEKEDKEKMHQKEVEQKMCQIRELEEKNKDLVNENIELKNQVSALKKDVKRQLSVKNRELTAAQQTIHKEREQAKVIFGGFASENRQLIKTNKELRQRLDNQVLITEELTEKRRLLQEYLRTRNEELNVERVNNVELTTEIEGLKTELKNIKESWRLSLTIMNTLMTDKVEMIKEKARIEEEMERKSQESTTHYNLLAMDNHKSYMEITNLKDQLGANHITIQDLKAKLQESKEEYDFLMATVKEAIHDAEVRAEKTVKALTAQVKENQSLEKKYEDLMEEKKKIEEEMERKSEELQAKINQMEVQLKPTRPDNSNLLNILHRRVETLHLSVHTMRETLVEKEEEIRRLKSNQKEQS